jgi:hypothetical protein
MARLEVEVADAIRAEGDAPAAGFDRVARLAAAAGSRGRYALLTGVPPDLLLPGLHHGLGGVGLELLRCAAPSRVRSVLLME